MPKHKKQNKRDGTLFPLLKESLNTQNKKTKKLISELDKTQTKGNASKKDLHIIQNTLSESSRPKAMDSMNKDSFIELFKNPLIKKNLPSDFDKNIEAEHIATLYQNISHMQDYKYKNFVHVGGSGIVFEVSSKKEPTTSLAMKVVRHKLYTKELQHPNAAQSLSPISEAELRALEIIHHPNVVRLYDTIGENQDVVAICTSYINPPKQIDEYIIDILGSSPSKSGLKSFSPERLDLACDFLISRFTEIASALSYMHNINNGNGIYHFDIKPANILISKSKIISPTVSSIPIYNAILTDMGSCIHGELIRGQNEIRVHFSWPYAHTKLRDLVNNPEHITGGLKVSAKINPKEGLAQYDLFSFGKTIQQLLAILFTYFGERCHSSYGFRFLHIIACMLLDGNNSLDTKSVIPHDKISFVNDRALIYHPNLWIKHKITSATELLCRLNRFKREYSWNEVAPELDLWQPQTVNCVAHAPAPFTDRVAQIMNHPCMRRLKSELQLGWIREIFPGASHDRWSHCLGTFSALVGYYNSLLSDPEVPTFRIFADKDDLSHAFVAALIHDLGQTTFGHDFEEACPKLFQHEDYIIPLLYDDRWGDPTLAKVITDAWNNLDIERMTTILHMSSDTYADSKKGKKRVLPRKAIDGVAADAINGPIDADKLDYLLRDSIACGVPYGHGMDTNRFLQALTVSASSEPRLCLAYKAKGRPAIASLLLARYQMYGAVYWHHTFRCIQSMFVHAAATVFYSAEKEGIRFKNIFFYKSAIQKLFYERVICRATWKRCTDVLIKMGIKGVNNSIWKDPPPSVSVEPALDFVWQFGNASIRELIERLAQRKIYKRVYEIPLGQLNEPDYTAIAHELSGPSRLNIAKELQVLFFNEISEKLRGFEKETTEKSAIEAHDILGKLKKMIVPLIILDFPTRVIKEYNVPSELEDSVRKYLPIIHSSPKAANIVSMIWQLQKNIATVRVFAEPLLHELIIRYLDPDIIHNCIVSKISSLRQIETE
jgi:HD superfamily phosphohydrolase